MRADGMTLERQAPVLAVISCDLCKVLHAAEAMC